MCDKAVDNYLHVFEFVRKCYKTKKILLILVLLQLNLFLINLRLKKCVIKPLINIILCLILCDKAVDKYHFVFDSVPDQFKTHKMCDKIVSDDPFKLKYCNDRYKSHKMCDKAVDDCQQH